MYSQHKEDEYLLEYIKHNRLNPPKTIVEIGAWDPQERSNSRMFIERGWSALLVEPLTEQFEKIRGFYLEDKNINVLNCAVGQESGKGQFIIHPDLPDHAHLCDPDNENYDNKLEIESEVVHVLTLVDLLQTAMIEEIGILSIDTEGMDTIIAQQLIDSEHRPWFVIIEGNNAKSTKKQYKILNKAYRLIKTKNVNTIWIYDGI